MPEPGSCVQRVGDPGVPLDGAEPGTTASRSEARASEPRSVTVSSPSWAATSAVTRSLAVAVVASTGVPGASASSVRVRRW